MWYNYYTMKERGRHQLPAAIVLAMVSAILFYIVRNFDPAGVSLLLMAGVYAAIFVWVWSFVVLVAGFLKLPYPLRQGVLFASLVCLCLWLLANSLFSFVTAGLALIIFVLLEFYAISN